jgi:hypothetical protein
MQIHNVPITKHGKLWGILSFIIGVIANINFKTKRAITPSIIVQGKFRNIQYFV